MAMRVHGCLLFILACGNGALFSQAPVAAEVYYAGIVRKGPKLDSRTDAGCRSIGPEQRRCLENLAAQGVLVLAGPFTDNRDIRGIYVFKVDSQIEAKKLCDAAPLVKSRRLLVEIHPWQMAKEILTRE